MASNASGYPEALCLLGKIFPKPHFRMTSHAAARTLRCAFQDGGTPSTLFFLFLLSFLFFFLDAKYPFHIGTHRQQLPHFILRLMIRCICLLFLLSQRIILSLNLFYLRYLLCTKRRESLFCRLMQLNLLFMLCNKLL